MRVNAIKATFAGSLISLAAAGGLWYYAPAALCLISEPGFVALGHGQLNNYTGDLGCAAVLALAFMGGLAVAVGGLTRVNHSKGLSLLGRVLLFLGAAAAIAAGLSISRVTWTMIHSFFFTISRGGTMPNLEDFAERWASDIGAFRMAFLLLLGTPIALVAASTEGMDGPPRKAARRWLTAVAVGLTLVVGLVFTAAYAVNSVYAYRFHLAIVARPEGINPSDAAATGAATLIAQFVAGNCLLLVGVILGFVACLLVGRQTAGQTRPRHDHTRLNRADTARL
jgi:hypothetical protein